MVGTVKYEFATNLLLERSFCPFPNAATTAFANLAAAAPISNDEALTPSSVVNDFRRAPIETSGY